MYVGYGRVFSHLIRDSLFGTKGTGPISWDAGKGIHLVEKICPENETHTWEQYHPEEATTAILFSKLIDTFTFLFLWSVLFIHLFLVHRAWGWVYRNVRCKLPARHKLRRLRVHTNASPGSPCQQHCLCTQCIRAWVLVERGGVRWIRICFIFIKKKM